MLRATYLVVFSSVENRGSNANVDNLFRLPSNTRLVEVEGKLIHPEMVVFIEQLHALEAQKQAKIGTETWLNFMILGVKRGGVKLLSLYLDAHHSICLASSRDSFFSSYAISHNYDEFREWFLHCHANATLGEAARSYFSNDMIAWRVRRFSKHLKFIVLLRNPVDRFISQYCWRPIRRGRDWDAALEAGLYAKQARPWFDKFPRESFLFIKSEDLLRKAGENNYLDVLSQIEDFLGVSRYLGPNLKFRHNSNPCNMDEGQLQALRSL